jgi:tRNA threonylcarbamoyladenosine biosynthesis protein TsaB
MAQAPHPVADNQAMSVSPSFTPPLIGPPLRLLALETSTDTLSLALGSGVAGGPLWQHNGPGGAQASATLLPLLHNLLTQAGWTLQSLDALVFGRGPGSFTGLRTACAVAQGLAYGAQSPARPGGLPVLAVDTLLALAEAALDQDAASSSPSPRADSGVVVALLDARMNELYVAPYAFNPQGLHELAPPRLCAPQQLGAYLAQSLPPDAALAQGACLLAGNVFDTYAGPLADVPGRRIVALPSAAALLRLAPGLLAAGAAVVAQDALPLYVRDKVAQTTAERDALRLGGAASTTA